MSSPSDRRLGFIGLGNLGRPLAANLLAAGFPLTVHDRDAEAARQLVADGAAWADSPAGVGDGLGHRLHLPAVAARP